MRSFGHSGCATDLFGAHCTTSKWDLDNIAAHRVHYDRGLSYFSNSIFSKTVPCGIAPYPTALPLC